MHWIVVLLRLRNDTEGPILRRAIDGEISSIQCEDGVDVVAVRKVYQSRVRELRSKVCIACHEFS